MATVVTLRQAQEELASLLELVKAGEAVLIADGGRVIAQLSLPAELEAPADETSATPRFEPLQRP
jgi:antitoxin (DNA-binding transcriptional repressor) of toxin-antitoxin stability system